MGHINTCYYRGNRHFPDIKSILIKTRSFFAIFHYVIVSILVEWLLSIRLLIPSSPFALLEFKVSVNSFISSAVKETVERQLGDLQKNGVREVIWSLKIELEAK